MEKFIAFRGCGCVQGFANILEESSDTRKSAASAVSRWIKDGMYIMHLQGELAENYVVQFDCKDHGKIK